MFRTKKWDTDADALRETERGHPKRGVVVDTIARVHQELANRTAAVSWIRKFRDFFGNENMPARIGSREVSTDGNVPLQRNRCLL